MYGWKAEISGEVITITRSFAHYVGLTSKDKSSHFILLFYYVFSQKFKLKKFPFMTHKIYTWTHKPNEPRVTVLFLDNPSTLVTWVMGLR